MKAQDKFVCHVGVGYWGKNIFRNLYELGVLHTACDTVESTMNEFKEKFPDVNYTSSFEAVLKNLEIRAVSIATPAFTHYEFVKRALLAGKDVFVEKPLSLSTKEGEEIVEIAKNENRVLMVGHILQYHPAVIKLKEMVKNGELGKIEYIYSNRLNIGKLRTEENILWSFAPHDISVILHLLDEEPGKVTTIGGDYLTKDIFDTTLTSFEFRGGVRGHIFVSWLHPFKEQKLVVVGSESMAVFDDMSKEKLYLYPHKIEWKDGKVPVAKKADFKAVPISKDEPLKEEMKHFISCVLERKTPKTDGQEGLRVLKVLERGEKCISANYSAYDTAGAYQCRQASAEPSKIEAKRLENYFKHESAYVDKGVSIGDGTKIWHFSHVLKGTVMGKDCIVGQNVLIGPDVTVGDRCKIQNNVALYKGVILEDEVFCGPSCVFTNVYNPRAFIERKNEYLPTLIKKGATIGANATIVCGNTIGMYALIGAGAVIKKDVPDYAVFAGVPARQIGWACKCGTTLKFEAGKAVCGACSNEYGLEDKKFIVLKEK